MKTKPAYLKLYESLREEILTGSRPFGSRLPSRRELVRERQVSAVTVDHSFELLCEEGYIVSRPKSGYYVIYREADGFSQAADARARQPAPAPEHRPAAAPERDAFPFSPLARIMRRVLTEYGEEILVRSPHAGCPELRAALSGYLARNRGIHVRPDQIVVGAGAEYLYGITVELLGADRIYGIESPSYRRIEQVYRSRGVRVDHCPLGRDGILSEALRGTAASVLHLTPFRSYPSGVTASASKRREYLRWASRPDRFLVEDDYESEFSLLRKPEETLFANAAHQNVIYLNTFTRTISPALRIGYMVLPPKLLSAFEERLGFYSCTVPVFEQYVLTELLNGGEFERHINRIRRNERKALETRAKQPPFHP